MADLTQSSSSEIQKVITEYNSSVEEFNAATTNIRNSVTTLQETFHGQGSQAFNAAAEKWSSDMKTVGENLTSLSTSLKQVDAGFQQLDASTSKTFSGFGSGPTN